ncbi:MAG: hypothetical protein GTO62_19095, partial [Planctomycetales bacterium]|nr:hypothetical protein [Planctomycetales bacterium]
MRVYVEVDAGFDVSAVRQYYSGLVATMLTGPAAGQSRRVVASVSDVANRRVRLDIVAFDKTEDVDGDGNPDPPQIDDLILLNGRPFSGMGLGFDPTTGKLAGTEPFDDFGRDGTANTGDFGEGNGRWDGGEPFDDDGLDGVPGTGDLGEGNNRFDAPADEPNLAFFVPAGNIAIPGGYGGLNEDYDAPDFNNPWLAVKLPGANRSQHIKPSWHDPKLMGSTPTQQNSFRPRRSAHPNFTGSNPSYMAVQEPFVDANNNGAFDSGEPYVDLNENDQWDP